MADNVIYYNKPQSFFDATGALVGATAAAIIASVTCCP